MTSNTKLYRVTVARAYEIEAESEEAARDYAIQFYEEGDLGDSEVVDIKSELLVAAPST